MTKFIDDLKKNLIENKKISENSMKAYIKCLEKLNNGDDDIKNLDFLKNYENIKKIIDEYKPNTQRNFYIAICSILSLYPQKYKKLYRDYFAILKNINKTLKEEESKNEKSETQKENWVEWKDVEKTWADLKNEVNKFSDKKELNHEQYNTLLSFVVLSLYTLQPPRRNSDFNMFISKNSTEKKDLNYLNLDHDDFIFNNFKTKKTEGSVTIPLTDQLKNVIMLYLKHHPLIEAKALKNKRGIIEDVPFLVFKDGKPINPTNGITYILNKIFGKNTGCSILRHSYLSSKYGDIKKEQEEDAKAMSHSTGMQKDYIKN